MSVLTINKSMIKVDLVTGFLGAGKTTFIRRYAQYLIDCGYKVGILENDYGAVNVDMMLLGDLQGENCGLEMISGGCDLDCHRRRFKTKLIAMAMSGYDRVIVEPSGIFNVDEFFDILCEEPLERWYEKGSVIAVANLLIKDDLSEYSEYMLTSQIANAGCVVLSRTQYSEPCEIEYVKKYFNNLLDKFGCLRKLDKEVISKSWNNLEKLDFEYIASCGYAPDFNLKYRPDENISFGSLYFMNTKIGAEELKSRIKSLFKNKNCGKIFRIKGFVSEDDSWFEINATYEEINVKPILNGQNVIIVIGENLEKNEIDKYFSE